MLNDTTCFKKAFIVTGYTICVQGLTVWQILYALILGKMELKQMPYILFCGRRTDRIKGLV
nr:hypothetical protein [uncultured Anaerobutyricum sp.]